MMVVVMRALALARRLGRVGRLRLPRGLGLLGRAGSLGLALGRGLPRRGGQCDAVSLEDLAYGVLNDRIQVGGVARLFGVLKRRIDCGNKLVLQAVAGGC